MISRNAVKATAIVSEFAFEARTLEELVVSLATDDQQGLETAEAKKRLVHYGKNAITEQRRLSLFQIFANQFKNPMAWLLLLAAGVSFGFKEKLDGIAILVVVLINAITGFYMEVKAQQSMNALKHLSSVPAKVIRDGKLLAIDSEELVPGDLVFLEAGDVVPADGRIARSARLQVNESALTGESEPVEKRPSVIAPGAALGDRTNMAFKGTHVSNGNGYLLICATGMQTELGRIAILVRGSEQAATPLEKKLEEFSKNLIWFTATLVIVIFGAGLFGGTSALEMFETSIALAVAAIPEGLPIVATMALAFGMLKMSRYNVIVKKLSAVETLGGTNVICTDKTGTLTQNSMEVVCVSTPSGRWKRDDPYTGDNEYLAMAIKCVVLCNTADLQTENGNLKEIGDPLETALLRFADIAGGNRDKIRGEYVKVEEYPFSSETKMMATLHRYGGRYVVFAKGASEELLAKSTQLYKNAPLSLSDEDKKAWLLEADQLASSGHRVLAMAFREADLAPDVLTEDLVFLGLVAMIDPPRTDVLSAIEDCKGAGIKVIMVTGDHPATAQYIAGQVGISNLSVLPVLGRDMKDYRDLTEEDKQRWINTSVFARVDPKHKLDLVKVLQEKGFTVGMTGDGVNDAPALKKADIGIAMGERGTQVAQDVADMVLKNDSFASIVIAIKEGRTIFANIKKFVTFLLSCNISELLVIATAAILNLHFQLVPLQILFINLITDVLPALALSTVAGSSGIMRMAPRKSSLPIISTNRWKQIIAYSFVIAATSMGAVIFNHVIYHNGQEWDAAMCNNVLFFTLIFSQLLHVFNMGVGPFFRNEVIRNRMVWYSIIISISILLLMLQFPVFRKALNIIPMTLQEWVIVFTASITSLVSIQFFKNLKGFQ